MILPPLNCCRPFAVRIGTCLSLTFVRRSLSNNGIYDKNPLRRAWNIIKQDMTDTMKGKFSRPESEIFPTYCDIAIIGGGIIGSSVAYWLKQRASEGLHIAVIERDHTYARASTSLSVGGLRQQFSIPENIKMSLFGAHFLRNVKKHLSVLGMDPPDIHFTPHGYLFLASESGAETLKNNYVTQTECGAHVELLEPPALRKHFPWLNMQDVVLGCHGVTNEGWFDPWLLLSAFREKNLSLGVKYVKGEVVDFEYETLLGMVVPGSNDDSLLYETIKSLVVKLDNGETRTITPSITVLAAGPQSGHVAKLARFGSGPSFLEVPLPVEPRKRYVYMFQCVPGPGLSFPMMIDPTGTYCRRDGIGGNFLCGKSPAPDEEPDVSNLDVDYSFFEKQVWPTLAHRVPNFEAIRLQSAWAGYYDYNIFDQNGIIGIHPHYGNLILATGFSGHGLQHAAAVGRAIMELIIDGDYETIDLSRFSFQRIIDNKPLFEMNIV